MIIGGGLIAKAMRPIDRDDITIFASGVSDSRETRITEFKREGDLLKANMGKKIIYFSTVPKNISPYMAHKQEMEDVVRMNNDHLIVRIPYIVGHGGNKANLFNYLRSQIQEGKQVTVYKDIYRSLTDIDDLVKLMKILHACQGTITISGIESLPIETIAKKMFHYSGKKENIKTVYGSREQLIENDDIVDKWIEYLKLKKEGYTDRVIKKYL